MALPTPFCAINSVTLINNTASPQMLEGSYKFAANETKTIDFTGMTDYHKNYLANAFNSADAAASPVISIVSST